MRCPYPITREQIIGTAAVSKVCGQVMLTIPINC